MFTSTRSNVIMKSTADNSIQGASSLNIGSVSGAKKINKIGLTGQPSKLTVGKTQDQIYQYSSFGRGAKRRGGPLYAMADDSMPSDVDNGTVATATVTGEGNTAWIDTGYQVTSKWDEPIEIDKNPFYKALKLGVSVFKDQKPPTIEQLTELNDTTKEFVEDNLPKF